eukprot:TRINITY_DN56228_c0_g1_i1.p1 TRINITY_DN56228_c0_g1~~TRINITY_DN56228_c0_g1_i1.p1  ORF type:complete len:332 (+),score=127.11 TRINITY_DN56228_c0_g1_i1:104-997(+)
MGGDGGAIANNRRFLPQAHMSQVKDLEEKDRYTVDRERWTRCQLSKRPLMPPLVADELGNLYCKEAVLAALQMKQTVAAHVRTLRDLTTIKPEPNPEKEAVHQALACGDDGAAEEELIDLWICPVTQQTANGRNKFMFGRSCGCVFAARAVAQVGGGSECPSCAAPATVDWENAACSNLLIPLCPDKDTTAKLAAKLEARRALLKEQKRSRKAQDQPAAGAPKRPRRRADDDGASVFSAAPPPPKAAGAAVGRDAPPPGADPEVWRRLFRAPRTQPDGVGESFLCRGGMLGPSHKAA